MPYRFDVFVGVLAVFWHVLRCLEVRKRSGNCKAGYDKNTKNTTDDLQKKQRVLVYRIY